MPITFEDLEELIPSPDPTGTEPWEVAVGDLIRKTGKVPAFANKALRLFDRFGAVHIGPEEIGFDDDTVRWDKVVELRTHRVSNLLTGKALEREVERIRGYLPPVPGRKWVVNKVANLTLDLTLAVWGDLAKDVADTVDGVNADDGEPAGGHVVSEIVHKGALRRTKELRGGLFAAAVMVGNRDVSTCLRQAAAMRGIPVVASEDDHFEASLERGVALRERFDTLATMARRVRETLDKDVDDDPDREGDPDGDDTRPEARGDDTQVATTP